MSKIYIIENPEAKVYKIGCSKNPIERLKTLQTGNHVKLNIIFEHDTKHNQLLETTIHRRYIFNHVNGEWFKFDDNELEQVKRAIIERESVLDLKNDLIDNYKGNRYDFF